MEKISSEEKQRYKLVSKILSILLRIGNVCCWIGAGALILVTIAIAILAPNFSLNTEKKELTLFGNTANYTLKDRDLRISDKEGNEVIIKDNALSVISNGSDVVSIKLSGQSLEEIEKFIEQKLPRFIYSLPFVLAFVSIMLIYFALALGHGASICWNIATKKTPFIKDNITRTEKAFKYMLISAVLAFAISIASAIVMNTSSFKIVSFSSVGGLFATYIMIYIFKAGYQLEDKKETVPYDINEEKVEE